MILRCNYEEMKALQHGARTLLHAVETPEGTAVAAPPVEPDLVEALLPRLEGDVAVSTLVDQRTLLIAVEAVVEFLRQEMATAVVASHPAAEVAVAAYFDYAHALSVLGRLREIGDEMEALIEVVTGSPADEETALRFRFPD